MIVTKIKYKHLFIRVLAVFFVSLAITACGSSSSGSSDDSASTYNGITTAVKFDKLTEDQKKQVGGDSAKVILEAVNLSDTDDLIGYMPLATQIKSNIRPPKTLERRVAALSKQAGELIKDQLSSPLN